MADLVGWRYRRGVVTLLLVCASGFLISSCGLASDAGSAVTAPLVGLKDTDTVVETNLKTLLTTVQVGEPVSQGGIATTSGPSTGAGVVSESGSSGQAVVLAGFNTASNDCLGAIEITTAGSPVLGQSQPGTYYFWVVDTTSAGCDAASFAATPSVPSGWPSGDPSASGWPLP